MRSQLQHNCRAVSPNRMGLAGSAHCPSAPTRDLLARVDAIEHDHDGGVGVDAKVGWSLVGEAAARFQSGRVDRCVSAVPRSPWMSAAGYTRLTIELTLAPIFLVRQRIS
jgi:hypothetical protein